MSLRHVFSTLSTYNTFLKSISLPFLRLFRLRGSAEWSQGWARSTCLVWVSRGSGEGRRAEIFTKCKDKSAEESKEMTPRILTLLEEEMRRKRLDAGLMVSISVSSETLLFLVMEASNYCCSQCDIYRNGCVLCHATMCGRYIDMKLFIQTKSGDFIPPKPNATTGCDAQITV